MSSKHPKILSSNSPTNKKEVKSKTPDSFYSIPICWKIGRFDHKSMWGLDTIKGKFLFETSEELILLLADRDDNELYNALGELEGKEYSSIVDFIHSLSIRCNNEVHLDIIKKLIEDMSFNYFMDKVFPKMRNFEGLSWNEIDKERYGKEGKSKHHFVSTESLINEARKRLEEIGLPDLDEIFSLRLEGEVRIYGIRKQNYLEIIWFDLDHKICPSNKKHT